MNDLKLGQTTNSLQQPDAPWFCFAHGEFAGPDCPQCPVPFEKYNIETDDPRYLAWKKKVGLEGQRF